MGKSRFGEQQIALNLRQAEEGATVEEVCCKAGISLHTHYRWRSEAALRAWAESRPWPT